MPIDWRFADNLINLGGTGRKKLEPEDGLRQQATARAILEALRTQPGVILADEVGMGKTYVALAVVASALLSPLRKGRPVVVMMPPGLASKWPKEWDQFKAVCCSDSAPLKAIPTAKVESPTEFFRVLDDSRSRRAQLIWMPTSCFSAGLSDGWIKLAFIRFARANTKMDEETKRKLYKWATTMARLKSKGTITPELIDRLMRLWPSQWHHMLKREGILSADSDDPIPKHLLQHQNMIDWSALAAVIRGETIPGRRGSVSSDRLRNARQDFNDACQDAYWEWLKHVRWRASLMVMDEAHHAKNDNTRLARLLRSDDTTRLLARSKEVDRPLLWDKFDRMLFLTATPFQLGHQELIRVLRSFAAAKWAGPLAPAQTRENFLCAMNELEEHLSRNRLDGRRLDRLWGRLRPDRFASTATVSGDLDIAVQRWLAQAGNGGADSFGSEILRAIDTCRQSKEAAQSDERNPWCGLRPWVIRHNRPLNLPSRPGRRDEPRRICLAGAAISETERSSCGEGLAIGDEGAVPFLLAARAQGELAGGSSRARAFFAEGLCSSYEAFHHTRQQRGDTRDMDDDGVEVRSSCRKRDASAKSLVPVGWYEAQIERLIPSKAARDVDRYHHPKVRAVVDETVRLWRRGEKVLLFCFYRETAKSLLDHIRREVDNATAALASDKLGLASGQDREAHAWLQRISRRLADEGSQFHKEIIGQLRRPFESADLAILRTREDQLVSMLAAYVRSPSFVARYLPLDVPQVRDALSNRQSNPSIIQAGVRALREALAKTSDDSGTTMLDRVAEFLDFAKELAEQEETIKSDDEERPRPLREYLDAVTVHISPRGSEDEGGRDGSYRAVPAVRMVYGDTSRSIRERVMLAFNSPLFPEILISSAVLGEGVDLHRFCRHVIHHDLCWNPSTIEQRTGRLDRIRCKAELVGHPIVVYEPYIAGSADEKMFRVVRDREKWFQIVMGQRFEFDEGTSEELSNRVPLPSGLAKDLIFDLRCYRGKKETPKAAIRHARRVIKPPTATITDQP